MHPYRKAIRVIFVEKAYFRFTLSSLLIFFSYGILAQNSPDANSSAIWNSIQVEDIKEDKHELLSSIPEILEAPTEYHYAAFGKADPFVMPYQGVSEKVKSGPIVEIPLVSPLQTALTNLSVKGIWEVSSGGRKALISVTQPGGKSMGVIAKVDDPIGLKGKIVRIDTDAVIARQYHFKADGTREFTDEAIPIGGKIILDQSATSQSLQGKILIDGEKKPLVLPDSPATQDVPVSKPAEGERK